MIWLNNPLIEECASFLTLHIGQIVAYGALRLSEAINPIVYIAGSRALWLAVLKTFELHRGNIRINPLNPSLSGPPTTPGETSIDSPRSIGVTQYRTTNGVTTVTKAEQRLDRQTSYSVSST